MPSKPFRLGFEAHAAQSFTFAGTSYAAGERFPYRELGIIDFEVRGLWMAERIEFSDEVYRPSDAELERLTAPRAPQPAAKQPRR